MLLVEELGEFMLLNSYDELRQKGKLALHARELKALRRLQTSGESEGLRRVAVRWVTVLEATEYPRPTELIPINVTREEAFLKLADMVHEREKKLMECNEKTNAEELGWCSSPICAVKPRMHSVAGLLKCSLCGTVRYCSKQCQIYHWKNGHRQLCKAPEKPSS